MKISVEENPKENIYLGKILCDLDGSNIVYVSIGACTWIQLNDHLKYKSLDSQWNRHYIAMLIYSESE